MKSQQEIKNEAFFNVVTNMIPNEGELITVKGGLGNMTLDQRKKEDGVYLRRGNETQDWVEFDPAEEVLNFIKGFRTEK